MLKKGFGFGQKGDNCIQEEVIDKYNMFAGYTPASCSQRRRLFFPLLWLTSASELNFRQLGASADSFRERIYPRMIEKPGGISHFDHFPF